MEEIILFVLTFLLAFLGYRLFIVFPIKQKKKKKKKYKDPFEVTYLVTKYKLNIEKVNYNRLLLVISTVSSFDIALIVTVIVLLKNFVLEIIGGFIFTMLTILVSYHIVFLFYKKKGMINNG